MNTNILFRTIIIFFIIIQSLFASQIQMIKKDVDTFTNNTVLNSKFTQKEKNYLSKKMPLIVHGHNSFPPFNYSENDELLGYTSDYMNLMSKYSGIKFQFTKPTPWGEAILKFKNNEIDILPHVARNKAREKYISYTNFNHLEYLIGATVRKNETIRSMDDLKDKVIAVVNQSFVHTFLKKNYLKQKLLVAPATSDAVELVSSGKADAFIGSIPMMNFYIKKSWFNNLTTRTIDGLNLNSKVMMPMGVHKSDVVLKSILEKANLLIPFNEIAKLREKWLSVGDLENRNFSLNEEEKLYLNEKEVIKVCIMPNSMPFGKLDADGKYIGIANDIVEIISKKIDKKILLVNSISWKDTLQNLAEKRCDIIPTIMDVPNRHASMNFTKPYITEPFVVVTKSDKKFMNDSSELSNKKIGMIKSYAFLKIFKEINPNIEIISVKSAKDGLEKVRSGELYGYLDSVSSVIFNIQDNSMSDLKIAGKMEFDIKLSIASRNDEPLLNSILQKTLDTISEEEIKRIFGRWLSIKIEQKVDYTLLFQMSFVFLIIILIGVYKNRQIVKLNQKLEEQQLMVDKYVLILNTNLEGKIIEVNNAYCKRMGFTREELLNHDFTMIRHPDMTNNIFKGLWEQITNGRVWRGEIKNLTKEGETVYFNIIIEPLIQKGIKIGYRSIAEDVTDKKRIEILSVTDKLTGLYNRHKIDEILDTQIKTHERYKTPFSIILFDLDDFKNVNDTYGHDIGDYVLKTIADIVRKNIRKTDEVGRWGGEEFVIICPNTEIDDVFITAEYIRKKIEKNLFHTINKQTISIGVTEYYSQNTILDIFRRVDQALYEAKGNGKNQTIKA